MNWNFLILAISIFSCANVARGDSIGSRWGTADGYNNILSVLGSKQIYVNTEKSGFYDYGTHNAAVLRPDQGYAIEPFFQGAGFNGQISQILPIKSGGFYIAGSFSDYNGQPNSAVLVKLRADGTLDPSFVFQVVPQVSVTQIGFADDGSKDLWVVRSDSQVVRISSLGSIITQVNLTPTSNYDRSIYAMSPTGDGKGGVLLSHGGLFEAYNAKGEFNPAFQPKLIFNRVSIILPVSDGILVGGLSSSTMGNRGNFLLQKLNFDGTTDTTFDSRTGFDGNYRVSVTAMALAADGSNDIYVAGEFDEYNGFNVSEVVRLNPNGLLDRGFQPKLDFTPLSIEVRQDGSLLVAGGTAEGGLIGLQVMDSQGKALNSSDLNRPYIGNSINSAWTLPSGAILIGGNFDYLGSVAPSGLYRVNADGSPDSSFKLASADRNTYVKMIQSPTDPTEILALSDNGALVSIDITSGQIRTAGVASDVDSSPLGILLIATGQNTLGMGAINSLEFFDCTQGGSSSNCEIGRVRTVAAAADGSVWVSGSFSHYGKTKVGPVVHLDPKGNLIGSLNLSHSYYYPLWTSPDRKTVAMRIRTSQNREDLLVIDAISGTTRGQFELTATFQAIENDGSVLISTSNGGGAGLKRLKVDGSVDPSFKTDVRAYYAVSVSQTQDGSGDYLLGGSVYQVNGVDRHGIARIHADGTLVQ